MGLIFTTVSISTTLVWGASTTVDVNLKKSTPYTLDMAELSSKVYDAGVKQGTVIAAKSTGTGNKWQVKRVLQDEKKYGKIILAELDKVNEKVCAMVVRGTSDAKTALTDNMDWGTTTLPGTKWKVHKGFQSHITAIRKKDKNGDDMDTWFKNCKTRGYKKIISGHSLGGAVATWLTIYYESKGANYATDWVVTFGAPRLVQTFGKEKCPKSLQHNRSRAARIVTTGNGMFVDAAPLMPGSTNSKEASCFDSFSLDKDGNLLPENDQWPNWSFNFVINGPGWDLHSMSDKYIKWLVEAKKKVKANAPCKPAGTHCDNIGSYWGKGNCSKICCFGYEYNWGSLRHECKPEEKPCKKSGEWCDQPGYRTQDCGRCCNRDYRYVFYKFRHECR